MTDRGQKRLGDVEVGDRVLTHKGRFRPVTELHEQGDLPTMAITTFCGRRIVSALDHPFLTPSGWTIAADLKPGDLLGAPVPVEAWGDERLTGEEARLLGYFVGDGSTSSGNARITSYDPATSADILKCAAAMGFGAAWEKRHREAEKGAILFRGGVRPWLESNGLRGLKSGQKRIPTAVWTSGPSALAEFLAGHFAADGSVNQHGKARRDCVLSSCTISDHLAEDLVQAYALLGIRARRRVRELRPNFGPANRVGPYTVNVIDITSRDDVDRFTRIIPLRGIKAERLAAWPRQRRHFDQAILADPIARIELEWARPCRCLTVEEDGSFVAEGLAVKNSDLVSVCWPAWTWLQDAFGGWPLAGPWVRFLCVSHSYSLAVDHSRKCRMLVESDWYQRLSQSRVRISPDANMVDAWQLEGGGGRRAFSVETRQTGWGGDIQIFDDLVDAREVNSAATRATVRTFIEEMAPGSINDPRNNARVIVAQRTHVEDPTAMVLEGDEAYEYVCLPGTFEPDHPHRWAGDWRTEPGELLWPERFPSAAEYDGLAGTAYARAAQVQQNPQKRGLSLFANAEWQFAKEAPANLRQVRYWDRAATPEGSGSDPDYTVGVRGGMDEQGRFWITDVQRGRWSPLQAEQRIRMVATQIDPPNTPIWIEEEGGSAGKDSISHYQRNVLSGYPVRGHRPTGSKIVRADAFIAAAEAGNVILLEAPWTAGFIEEAELFTGDEKSHDDQIDAAVGCHGQAARSRVALTW